MGEEVFMHPHVPGQFRVEGEEKDISLLCCDNLSVI